jgi:hypothetical protein
MQASKTIQPEKSKPLVLKPFVVVKTDKIRILDRLTNTYSLRWFKTFRKAEEECSSLNSRWAMELKCKNAFPSCQKT